MARRMVLERPGSFIEETYSVPEPKPGEVLVKVAHCGICGTDLHAYEGRHPSISTPIVLGHEFSGVVQEVGVGVDRDWEGARVTANPIVSCGVCRNCRAGRSNTCESIRVLGCQLPGAYQSMLAVATEKLVRLPESISLLEGAIIEPLAVACHALLARRPVRGCHVLVLGCGPIGYFAAQVARAGGAEFVIAVDKDPFRLSLAERAGVDCVLDTGVKTLRKSLEERALLEKVDVVVDCIGGDGSVLDEVLKWIPRGIDVVSIGVFTRPTAFRFLDAIPEREIRIIGSTMYTTEDFRRAVGLVVDGRVPVSSVIGPQYEMADVASVFPPLIARKTDFMKAVLGHE